MAKHIIKTDQELTVNISAADSRLIIARGANLAGIEGLYNYMVDDAKVTVAGSISGGGKGIVGSGYNDNVGPNRFSIDVQKTGLVEGVMRAFAIVGNDTSIVNDGLIRSEQGAIEIHGNGFTLENHGKILGGTANAIGVAGADFSIENHGLIKTAGLYAAVGVTPFAAGEFINGADGTVIGGVKLLSFAEGVTGANAGRITATKSDGIAVEFGSADDVFTNTGRIEGMIQMGDGDDTVNLTRGKLGGSIVLGGDGDDTFVIGKSRPIIAEYEQGGNDTIKTSKSYTLAYGDSNFIEKLQAIGKDNVDLTGSSTDDNTLIGNDGNNVLTGGTGDDLLAGGKGADTLKAYMGEDSFSFFEGDGSDRILGFHKGHDTIRLNLFEEFKDFDDLDGRISLSADGEDTIIDLGNGDRVRLVDFHQTLEASDFQIIGDLVFP
jgi:Ca2+-binding RTX toxin-like protein